MSEPQVPPNTHSGTTAEAWGLRGPIQADRYLPVHGAPERDLFYVRSPVTGQVMGVSREEAEERIFRNGWEPVVEPDAVRLLEKQVMRDRASQLAAAGYGAARGISGGLAEFLLPQGEEPGAQALEAIREEYPGTALAGEVAGALVPLARVGGAARLASPVALAEAGGNAVTKALGGGIGARAVGMGLEGGAIGTTYAAGQSAIEDSPLTAQKIASGFLAGALPGAILGVPVGVAEKLTGGLGSKFAARGDKLRKEVLSPGVSDADAFKIAQREYGVADPGMLENLQATIGRSPELTPEFRAMAADKGPVGKAVREQLIDAENLRRGAETRAAAGLNQIHELDERALEKWTHGKPKRDLINQWISSDGPAEVDVDGVLALARRQDPKSANQAVESIGRAIDVDSKLQANLASSLATTEDDVMNVIARGLAAQDENVTALVSQGMREASPRAREAFSMSAARLLNQHPHLSPWRSQPLDLLGTAGKEADALMNQARGVLGQSRAEAAKVRDLIAHARKELVKGTRADAYAALDELKSRLGPHAKPDQWLGPEDNVSRLVRRVYEDVRQNLENPALWGNRAASAQREMNALFHNRLARADKYHRVFFDDAGVPHPKNKWVNARVATPEKVRSALAGITDQDGSSSFKLFKEHVAESRALAARMKEFYNLGADGDEAVNALLKGVDDAEAGLGEAVTFARREGQAKELFNNKGNVIPGYAKWLALGFLGAPGFIGAKIAETVANPGQRIYMRAVIERALRGSESRVAKGVMGLVHGKPLKVPAVGATQLAARGTASLVSESDPEKKKATYASSLAELVKLSTPEAATEQVNKAMPFLVGTLPAAPIYIAGMLSRGAQYVLAHAPAAPRMTPMGVQVELASDQELDIWERKWAGAFDPLTALEDAAAGNGSIEAIEAARAAAPELVQDFQQMIIEELANGKPVPYERRVDISIVLGVPLDATLEADYIGSQQMIHAARFKDSEAQASRRTGNEDGLNKDYRETSASAADKTEADIAPE